MLKLLARIVSGRVSRWVVVAVWVGLAVVFGSVGMNLADNLEDRAATAEEIGGDAESVRVAEEIRERFPLGEQHLMLIVYRRAGGLQPADEQRILADAGRAAEVEGAAPPVAPVGPTGRPELVSEDRSVAFTVVPLLQRRTEPRTESLEELREITGEGGGGLEVRVTGPAALQSDIATALEAVDAALLIATALLVLILLVAIYRSPIIPLLPLLVVGLSLAIGQGFTYLYSEAVDTLVSRTATAVVAVLVFGAGTDYCLLIVSRYSAALRRHVDPRDAMLEALPSAGPAVIASGLTVITALLTLLAASLDGIQIFGPVCAIGVAVVLLASVTLFPALLVIVGRRGFWPNGSAVELDEDVRQRSEPQLLPGLGALPREHLVAARESAGVTSRRETIWARIGTRVVAHPWRALVASTAVLGVCALGLLTYEEDVDPSVQIRNESGSTEGYDLIRTGFPAGALLPSTVLVDGPPDALPGAVAELRERVGAVEGVAAVTEVTAQSRDAGAVTFQFTFADDPYANPARDRIERIREVVDDAPGGARALVGEGTALRVDYLDGARTDQKRVIPLVLLVIFITLVILLRALVAPLYLLVTVLISYFGALGLSVAAFHLLGGTDTVEPTYPVLSFIFLVALGVDYNIFLMGAVREDAAELGTRPAILRAIRNTGPVITSAGIILAGTFAVLMTLPLEVLFQIGFTVCLGVLIDTFLVRTVMVPAIAWILDDRGWWPSNVSRGTSAPAASGTYFTPVDFGPLAGARVTRPPPVNPAPGQPPPE